MQLWLTSYPCIVNYKNCKNQSVLPVWAVEEGLCVWELSVRCGLKPLSKQSPNLYRDFLTALFLKIKKKKVAHRPAACLWCLICQFVIDFHFVLSY